MKSDEINIETGNAFPLAPGTLETPIDETLFCAVDVETSGLHMASRVVEIGAVRFDLHGNRSEYQKLVNPCEHISPTATEIHGITDEMVKSAPLARDVLPDLLCFMDGCVFVAHNASFDARMLGNELARAGIDAPRIPVLCTISLARRRIAGLPNYRLETLVGLLELGVGPLHNALPDANAAMMVFIAGLGGLSPRTPLGELPGLIGRFDSYAHPHITGIKTTGDMDELQQVAAARLTIEMDYETVLERGPVVVTALKIIKSNEHGYLKAYCHRDGIQKTYRLDRIVSFRRV